MKKILLTCPPMIGQLARFRERFDEYGFEVTAPEVVQTLSEDKLIEMVPSYDGWIIGDDPATAAVFTAGRAGRLRAAVKWGVGVDNVDFKACERLEIPIKNTPGMFGAEVADLAICYLIGLARDAFFIDREIREGRWPKPSGISLLGRTVGVVGLGDIGGNIVRRCLALGLKVIGWDPVVKSVPEHVTHRLWPEGIGECDFIIFACALTPATEHMFDDGLLNKLKFGVRLINVSRGGLLNEAVLVKALKSGLVLGAALDVFESEPLHKCHELRNFQQCIFGSHNASNTADAVERTSFLALDIMKSHLHGD